MQLGAVASVEPSQATEIGTSTPDRAEAFYTLGLLYSTGQGVPLDIVEAHKWFNLASVMGSLDARASREQVAQEMSVAEVAAAQRRAREWLRAS